MLIEKTQPWRRLVVLQAVQKVLLLRIGLLTVRRRWLVLKESGMAVT